MIIWVKKIYRSYKALDACEDIITLHFPNIVDVEGIA